MDPKRSPDNEIYNRFTDFFGEAFYLYDLARNESSRQRQVTFTQASILYCAFSLESAANSLLSEVDFSREPRKSFDKNLSIIAKFQLFHLAKTSRPREFRHDGKETESIREIIDFRNDQVHSKVHVRALDTDDDGFLVAPQITYSTHLRFPQYPYFLKPDNGLAALKAVDDFLNLFLLQWCSLSVDEASHILAHRMELDGVATKVPMSNMYFRDYEEAFKENGIGLKFLHPRIYRANRAIR